MHPKPSCADPMMVSWVGEGGSTYYYLDVEDLVIGRVYRRTARAVFRYAYDICSTVREVRVCFRIREASDDTQSPMLP